MMEPTKSAYPDQGRLSVLIPVYNEESTVSQVIHKVLALGEILKEVIVVDDGSTDGTFQVLSHLADQQPLIRLHRMEINRGKTAAIQKAIDQARGEIVIIQDADQEYDPAEIPEVIAPILQGHADVVYGSRFLVRKAARVLYFYHYLANLGLTFLSNLLTNRNMTDIETCYKAFKAGVIKPLRLTSRGFGMEVEITALICKTRTRTYEVPISYYGRGYDEGKKIGFRDGIMGLFYIFWYNLISPWLPSTKRYIREVNQYLQSEHRSVRLVSPDEATTLSVQPVPPARKVA
jgi:glycosyltransferase involved in cell wall biosynthesis